MSKGAVPGQNRYSYNCNLFELFPLPAGVVVPLYFTIQPGGEYIEVPQGSSGARLYYPNRGRAPAGTPFNFILS